MTAIPHIPVAEFTYELPDEKIALFPLSERDQSRLLVWNKGEITENIFSDITEIIPERSMLVFNNTRVIHARLFFRRETGSRIEIFCLEPHSPSDYQLSFQNTGTVEWKCLVGNAKKWKQGILEKKVMVGEEIVNLKARMIERSGNAFVIRFCWDQPVHFSQIIENAGNIAIPPYLNREAEASDNQRYQTMYAKVDGSVAAPTAGLHFTDAVMARLAKRKVKSAELTLHVGAGTFQPVKSETIAGHEMHTETVVVARSFIHDLLNHKGKVIAVGTTSVRSLESMYWLGAKLPQMSDVEPQHVYQWEPYHLTSEVSTYESLMNLLHWMDQIQADQISFSTSIIIVPGYRFRIIDGMVTNFHQPQSTLLLLVGAFLGNDWRKVYEYALRNDFRFLSYGDSNLYLR
ncbi:S-adenosylmethionine:tRNA ribosyltransferase-isomerase [Bacteroidales bacterium 6E]|nr:S-adenosylmethionine:tRNA ribosyltransferase-isomerase [Bacteroidales bacterium 6E]